MFGFYIVLLFQNQERDEHGNCKIDMMIQRGQDLLEIPTFYQSVVNLIKKLL